MRTVQNIPVYGGVLTVCVGDDLAKLIRDYKLGEPDIPALRQTVALTIPTMARSRGYDVGGWCVLLRPDADMDTVAHEATHVACMLLADRGADVEVNNSEPLAYLVGWAAGVMERALLRYRTRHI